MKVLAFVTVLAAVVSAAPTKEGGWWPFPWPFWGLQPYGPPSNGGGPGSNLPGGGNGNLPGGGNGNLPGSGNGNLPGGGDGGNPGNGNGNLPGGGNGGNPGSGTGGNTPVSGDNGSDSGSSTLCHGILTNSSPVCCSVDVLGVASLDCSIPSSAPTDGADFGAICSATGKSAQCCTLSLANIALLCQPAIGAQ